MTKIQTTTKKAIQAYILETMASTLGKVKEGMSDKKFNRNIKRASKLIAADFKIVKKKAPKAPKATKERGESEATTA